MDRKQQKVIRVICDCTDPQDRRAGIGDICRALGKDASPPEVARLREMLGQKEYRGYITVSGRGDHVRVLERSFAENARYERRQKQLLHAAVAVLAVLLAFFLGKFFR